MKLKPRVQDFKREDWDFERSSGWSGYRNANPDSPLFNEWIHEPVLCEMRNKFNDYQRDFELLYDFRLESLPFGQISDAVILEFLDKKYNK